jgi:hypothetical protein
LQRAASLFGDAPPVSDGAAVGLGAAVAVGVGAIAGVAVATGVGVAVGAAVAVGVGPGVRTAGIGVRTAGIGVRTAGIGVKTPLPQPASASASATAAGPRRADENETRSISRLQCARSSVGRMTPASLVAGSGAIAPCCQDSPASNVEYDRRQPS